MTIPAGVFPFATPSLSESGNLISSTSNGGIGDNVPIVCDGLGSVDFALGGAPVGAVVNFEQTSDGGNTWIPAKAYQKGGTGAAGSTTATVAGVYNVTVAGAQQVRARLTAITSGSFSCIANGTSAAAHIGVKNTNPADLNATVVPTVGGQAVSTTNPIPIFDAYQAPVAAAWTSATALNTAETLNTQGYNTVIFTIAPSGSVTGGAISFEVNDGTNWIPLKAPRTDSYLTDAIFQLNGAGTHSWQLPVAGYPTVRARLSTAIAGTGTVNLVGIVSSASDVSIVTVGLDPNQPLPAGPNVIGGVFQAPVTESDYSGSINGTVISATIASAGTGGTTGTSTVTGTTGTGTLFQASVTISGGAITGINGITVGGVYTATPTNPAAEPVTGGGLVGATLNLTMQGLPTQVMPANPNRRKLEFQPTSVTSTDWALNKSGNGVTAALGAKGSLQISAMASTSGRGDIYTDESTAAVYAYNATPFATFTASQY
jgi:hypothetical protein